MRPEHCGKGWGDQVCNKLTTHVNQSAGERHMSDIDSQSGGSSVDSAEVGGEQDDDWDWDDDGQESACTR